MDYSYKPVRGLSRSGLLEGSGLFFVPHWILSSSQSEEGADRERAGVEESGGNVVPKSIAVTETQVQAVKTGKEYKSWSMGAGLVPFFDWAAVVSGAQLKMRRRLQEGRTTDKPGPRRGNSAQSDSRPARLSRVL